MGLLAGNEGRGVSSEVEVLGESALDTIGVADGLGPVDAFDWPNRRELSMDLSSSPRRGLKRASMSNAVSL